MTKEQKRKRRYEERHPKRWLLRKSRALSAAEKFERVLNRRAATAAAALADSWQAERER